jgi:hypothetical protein
MALEIRVGDQVRLKKPHPCGGYHWRVTRLGADIGLACLSCRRYVMLPRSQLERRVKEVLPMDVAPDPADSA